MSEGFFSKGRIFFGLLLLTLLAGGIWGFPFIRRFLPAGLVTVPSPTPGLTSTPSEDQAAQAAVQAGAQVFCTIDYREGQQAWLDRLCAVSTQVGCEIDQNVFAPALWSQIEQAKTITTAQITNMVKVQNGVSSTRSDSPFQIWNMDAKLSAPWFPQKNSSTNFPALALVVKENGFWKFERFLTEQESNAISQKEFQP